MRGSTFQAGLQRLRIEGGEALVQDRQPRVLQQRAGQEDAAALAVRQLPAGFADLLHHAGGHAVQQVAQPQLVAERVRLRRSSRGAGQVRPISRLNASVPDRMWFSWNCGAAVASWCQLARACTVEAVQQQQAGIRPAQAR